MNNETSSVLSDPKVIIAVLALLVSGFSVLIAVCGLGWSLINQAEQNRRWDALNAGSIDLVGANLKVWRKMKRAEALATAWGYNPTIFYGGESDECRLVCRLRAYEGNEVTAKRVEGMNVVITKAEMEADLQRIGRANDPTAVVWKDYTLGFELENTGKTASSNCTAKIFALLAEGERQIFASNGPIRIPPGRKTHVDVDLSWAPLKPLPPILSFKVVTNFSSPHGKPDGRETLISWDTDKDQWMLGEITKSQ